MIRVFGSSLFINFINLNKHLLDNFFDPNIFKKQANVFFVENNNEIENLIKKNNYPNSEANIKIYFVNKQNKNNINPKYLSSSIFYPIKPLEFLNQVKSITLTQLLKKYGLFVRANIISNLQNEKKTNLTNTEIQLLNLLVLGAKVERKFLEKKVLNFKNEIASNSLDSHLVRLRKKIKTVNNKIEITSKESKHININLST